MNFAKIMIGATLLLCGCSEMRVIGAAAMRELRSEAIPVNWEKTAVSKNFHHKEEYAGHKVVPVRPMYFSTYRSNMASSKAAVKGLWERGS